MSFPNSEDSITSITGLTFTQTLTEGVALFAGKINTLDGMALRYNEGPGLSGFMNTSLVFNTIRSRTIPYAVTPWCRLTGDLQVAEPSTSAANTVIIPGIRLQTIF